MAACSTIRDLNQNHPASVTFRDRSTRACRVALARLSGLPCSQQGGAAALTRQSPCCLALPPCQGRTRPGPEARAHWQSTFPARCPPRLLQDQGPPCAPPAPPRSPACPPRQGGAPSPPRGHGPLPLPRTAAARLGGLPRGLCPANGRPPCPPCCQKSPPCSRAVPAARWSVAAGYLHLGAGDYGPSGPPPGERSPPCCRPLSACASSTCGPQRTGARLTTSEHQRRSG